MAYWISRCEAKRFIHGESVDICFTTITKVQGPFGDFDQARDALFASGVTLSTDERPGHTWTEYRIFTDEDIAREVRLLGEAMNRD